MSVDQARKATHDPVIFAKQAVSESGQDVLVAGSIGPLPDKRGVQIQENAIGNLKLYDNIIKHQLNFISRKSLCQSITQSI